jgi:hypothetical protein
MKQSEHINNTKTVLGLGQLDLKSIIRESNVTILQVLR